MNDSKKKAIEQKFPLPDKAEFQSEIAFKIASDTENNLRDAAGWGYRLAEKRMQELEDCLDSFPGFNVVQFNPSAMSSWIKRLCELIPDKK